MAAMNEVIAGWPLPRFSVPSVQELIEKQLFAPTSEYLARPSKGVRARLVAEGFRLAQSVRGTTPGGREQCLEQVAAAIEMIHAGSLILDDVQDQSELRRGRPAFHVEHGAPAAITAGSWLLAWPQQIIMTLDVEADLRRRLGELVLTTITEAHYGQILDVTTGVASLATADIPAVADFIARSKTGRLTACALEAGAILAGSSEGECAAISRLGEALGLLLQRLDDLGNCFGARAGRKRFEDLVHGRVSWLWACLAIQCPERRDDFQTAVAALPDDRAPVLGLAAELRLRENAESQAHEAFQEALAAFRTGDVGDGAGEIAAIADQLAAAFLS